MANEHKYTCWFSACGSRGYEVKRLAFNRGFSYRPLALQNGLWKKSGKRQVFATLREANMAGTAYMS